MKKITSLCVIMVVCLSMIISASALGNRKIVFESQSVNAYVGKQIKIPATVERVEADAPSWTGLVWQSSDESIARVDANGNVTGVSEGQVTIRAAAKDDDSIFAETTVSVRVPVQKMTMSTPNLTLLIGADAASAQAALQCAVEPANAFHQQAEWTSSNSAVATVDENGTVTAHSVGSATITAKTTDPTMPWLSATCRITVGQAVTGIAINYDVISVPVKASATLSAKIAPANASNRNVVWTSSDENVASVSAYGSVQGISEGEAVITATAADGSGVTGVCTVKVVKPVTAVKISAENNMIPIQGSLELKADVEPADATVKDIIWTSSNPDVAAVSQEGKVVGLTLGRAKITATSAEQRAGVPSKSASVDVVVIQPAESVVLESNELTIAKLGRAQLSAKVLPADATNQGLTWASSDPNIVAVDSRGSLSAKAVGSATITCTTTDGTNLNASCRVTVIQDVRQISPQTARQGVTEGKTITVSFLVSPADATNQKLRFESSDPAIATVDSNGVVTGVQSGTVTITARSTDGSNRSSTMKVVVEPRVTVDAVTFTRSGYFGYYTEFAVTFKNLTATKTIKRIDFMLKYSLNGETRTAYFYTGSNIMSPLGPGVSRQIGWWKESGLTFGSSFRIYLNSVTYTDGTRDYYSDELISWFV